MMTPNQIVAEMMQNDAFSKLLEIEIEHVSLGTCKAKMAVKDFMLNGFGVAHGGITFSFADSVFAFASNSHGYHAVSIETSISHTRPVLQGDVLTATAQELHRSKSLGRYSVVVCNQEDKEVALFYGTVFIKAAIWE